MKSSYDCLFSIMCCRRASRSRAAASRLSSFNSADESCDTKTLCRRVPTHISQNYYDQYTYLLCVLSYKNTNVVVVVVSGMQLLRLRSAIRLHHPPQRAVLSQICCFGERKVVLFKILLDGAEPRDAGTT